MKPKYRATAYRSASGTKTLYRDSVDAAKQAILSKIPDEIKINADWHVTIYERRYRVHDMCLMWKPIITAFVFDGGITEVPIVRDGMERFWSITRTESELLEETK